MGKTIPQLTSLSSPADGDYLLITDVSESDASKKITYQNFTSGMTLQTVTASYNAVDTTTSSIPYDDTIPQNTEGKEFMSVTITPKRANSKLRISFNAMYSTSAKATVVCAIFRDSTANALGATATECTLDDPMTNFFELDVDASSITATTFKVRLGTSTGTLTFNGEASARKFGDIPKSYIKVIEVAA